MFDNTFISFVFMFMNLRRSKSLRYKLLCKLSYTASSFVTGLLCHVTIFFFVAVQFTAYLNRFYLLIFSIWDTTDRFEWVFMLYYGMFGLSKPNLGYFSPCHALFNEERIIEGPVLFLRIKRVCLILF